MFQETLTSLKCDVIVILSEMFLSHFYHVRQIEHGDRGRGERLQHLPGQSAGAAWESLNKTHGRERIKVSALFAEGVKNFGSDLPDPRCCGSRRG